MKNNILIFLFASLPFIGNAQFPGGNNKDMAKAMSNIKGRVYGKLIDAKTKKPIEFASVVVLWHNKDSLLGGSLTKENGEFNIENLPAMGGFRFRATQIGYKKTETKFFLQMPAKLEVDLGDLKMELDEKLLGEVEVVAEKKQVEMSIDRRTYNVDKDISVRGGSAVDVMKNVPGVTVDGDGNAQLRNQSPTIFVDGRPTNLTLQQIPADQIDRIEVITNPSVKFDASATGGILNIVMKKNLKPGYNGMFMGYVGTGDRYGGMANFNLKE
ncbi:MAG TPA: carboxypeptidase regulatory-like domain-containing protein, partial [Bacteroidia bacterium]|nr:carboxypeptidase regulatory-like domain-containing protein [Bacteroidia bacterium]